jgi:hypothetical protein
MVEFSSEEIINFKQAIMYQTISLPEGWAVGSRGRKAGRGELILEEVPSLKMPPREGCEEVGQGLPSLANTLVPGFCRIFLK